MKTWLITGCSSGLGKNMAEVLLENGEQVAVTARRMETIQEFKERFPDRVFLLGLDVRNPSDVETAVSKTVEKFGKLDVLINNAGYGYRAALEEGKEEDVHTLFETNFFGAVRTIKAVLPHMRARGQGVIVNISSVATECAMPGSGYYAASKAALESVSDALKKEIEPLGIQVMVVEPGAFRTDFSGRSLTQSDTEIADYAQTAGKRKIGVEKVHGTQPGDPRKAAQTIIRIVQSGKIPFRLVLGSDAVKVVEDSLRMQMKELDERRTVSSQTNFENVENAENVEGK